MLNIRSVSAEMLYSHLSLLHDPPQSAKITPSPLCVCSESSLFRTARCSLWR